ncbi:efflux RND transporter periplasmic adaptor subunit [Flectobacillus longus]|uniref:Efflux RND transporter periplasmic adaptor subunit n=1 Tax=Flectobacillus longus TaxID=2984207 RepID=A0ABT6YJN0_9BACT|nr:efflux RND transporter periplasmic adaptor subunit [Flectobacillus longus]MDI9863351.1 efflux RND transporter periplasmic adaptor subunit [Flectobacillus longus]MDI9881580.1 efflux RND transporter periplasmic adaptor subunit [Flectobacillus longus]
MKRILFIVSLVSLSIWGCKKETKNTNNDIQSPSVSKDGVTISIPDKQSATFFKTETVASSLISADLTAPAQVVATVVADKVVLFSNPDLTSDYTELLNHQSAIAQRKAVVLQKQSVIAQKDAIIKQKQIEIERFEDLKAHGSATGKDVSDARTDKLLAESEKSIAQSEKASAEADLIAERSLIIEHSTNLKVAGFDPETLIDSPVGNGWIIADVSENQILKIHKGAKCQIRFTAYPEENHVGIVNGIADVMDNTSHMTKVRILINNKQAKFRSGMFALVSFGISEGHFISVDKNALITVQGKNFVFVKKDNKSFERREVHTGQQIGDRVIIFSGLQNNEQVVNTGAIQLKGLSFGY